MVQKGSRLYPCKLLSNRPQDWRSGLVNRVNVLHHWRLAPVIFDPDSYDLWLNPGMTKVEAVSDLLRPCDALQMRCFPVSTRINHVANDDEQCSKPAELAQIKNRLFS